MHELTKPVPAGLRTLSLVCVPYGGGSAVVYQPLANALPAGHRLFAVAIPGHDVGLDEDAIPFDELAGRCVAEVLAKVDGPIAVYGHCGVGSALAVEIARRLEAAGRRLETVYIGAIFPFARPRSRVMSALSRIARMERLRSDQGYANWLVSMGVDMGDLEPERARHIVRNMRKDGQSAEDYYTGLLHSGADRLDAPVVTIAGDRDPTTDFYQERYREWHFLTDTAAVFVLDEAGHFFLRYRAEELAAIITGTPPALDEPEPLSRAARGEDAGWWLHGVSRSAAPVAPTGPAPSMRRFLAVASGQLVSIIGSALTEFAVPLWIYLHTGSLFRFALFAVCGLVPGMLAAPLAGAVVDRWDRRRIMLLGDTAAGGTQLVLGILLWTGRLQIWEIYPLLVSLSVALTFQRLAYGSSVAQLVPKHYLGHANGVVQMIGGVAQILVPLIAVGLMAAIGLGGILAIDVASYAVAVGVVLFVRFPATMAWRRRETLLAEIAHGFRYSWGQPGFRAMLVFFAALNVFLAPTFPADLPAGALVCRPDPGGGGGAGRRGGRDPGRPGDGLLGRAAAAAHARNAAVHARALGVLPGHGAAAVTVDDRCRGVRHGAVADAGQRHLHHDRAGEGGSAVPRPGLRPQHPDRLVDAADRLGPRRAVRRQAVQSADGARRRPVRRVRPGGRRGSRPRDRADVPAVRRRDGTAGTDRAAHARARPVRRAGAGRGARRPDRIRGASAAAHVSGRPPCAAPAGWRGVSQGKAWLSGFIRCLIENLRKNVRFLLDLGNSYSLTCRRPLRVGSRRSAC